MVPRYLAFVLTTVLLVLFYSSPAFADSCIQSGAKIALHVASATSKIPCGVSPVSCASGIVTTGNLNQEYKVYVILTGLQYEELGFLATEISVNYDAAVGTGVDVLEFQSCATYVTTGDWPEPGSEIRMTYPSCQSAGASDPVILGWFGVIANTPGTLSIVYHPPSFAEPGTVPRLFACEGTEKLLDPANQGTIALGGGYAFNPCTDFADVFPGPCCFAGNSCQEAAWSLACCWAAGGRLLEYYNTCAQCVTPVLPKTWGQIKSRYH